MDARTPPLLHLDAELKPHRSLSPRGVLVLLVPFLFVNLVFATIFLIMGATVVPPFLGLDVLALLTALLVSFRSAEAVERIRVSSDMISVVREEKGRQKTLWTSPTAFTRAEVLDPGKHTARVRLAYKGRLLFLGVALSPAEREAFGRDLLAALRSARGERWRG